MIKEAIVSWCVEPFLELLPLLSTSSFYFSTGFTLSPNQVRLLAGPRPPTSSSISEKKERQARWKRVYVPAEQIGKSPVFYKNSRKRLFYSCFLSPFPAWIGLNAQATTYPFTFLILGQGDHEK